MRQWDAFAMKRTDGGWMDRPAHLRWLATRKSGKAICIKVRKAGLRQDTAQRVSTRYENDAFPP